MDIRDILFDANLTPFRRFTHGKVLKNRRLWKCSDLVNLLTGRKSLFTCMEMYEQLDVKTVTMMAIANLDMKCSVPVFLAMLAWVAPKCKDSDEGKMLATCYEVASIIKGVTII
uniref:LH2 n=1 Tax=Zoothera dauma adenovirus TaxID=3073259 RepID=A0AA51NPN6_9ADEN|nr:LH2 [Zoothera dauma adenovirus]